MLREFNLIPFLGGHTQRLYLAHKSPVDFFLNICNQTFPHTVLTLGVGSSASSQIMYEQLARVRDEQDAASRPGGQPQEGRQRIILVSRRLPYKLNVSAVHVSLLTLPRRCYNAHVNVDANVDINACVPSSGVTLTLTSTLTSTLGLTLYSCPPRCVQTDDMKVSAELGRYVWMKAWTWRRRSVLIWCCCTCAGPSVVGGEEHALLVACVLIRNVWRLLLPEIMFWQIVKHRDDA